MAILVEGVEVIENMEELLMLDMGKSSIINKKESIQVENDTEKAEADIEGIVVHSDDDVLDFIYNNGRFFWNKNYKKRAFAKEKIEDNSSVSSASSNTSEVVEVSILPKYKREYAARKALPVPSFSLGDDEQDYFLNRLFYDNPKHTYVTIDKLHEDGSIKSFKRPIKSLQNYKHYFEADELEGNIHVVPNSFVFNKQLEDGSRDMSKTIKNVHYINSFYVDCDIYNLGLTVQEALDKIKAISTENSIPTPSMIVSSGGGLYLFWKIVAVANNHKSILYHYDNIQAILCNLFAEVGADKQATDVVHMFKIAGTRNLKYDDKPTVKLVTTHSQLLEIWDFVNLLKDKYPVKEYKKKTPTVKGAKRKQKGNNQETFFQGLKKDFLIIDKVRSLKGNRNFVAFVLVSHMRGLGYNEDKMKLELVAFNNQLQEPQPERELFNVNFHHDSKFNAGWKFTTKHIVEKLNVSKQLQQELNVLMVLTAEERRERDRLKKSMWYKEDKEYKQRKLAQEKVRYSEKPAVISKREQNEKRDKLILQLKAQGYTPTVITKELEDNYDMKISLSTIKRICNK